MVWSDDCRVTHRSIIHLAKRTQTYFEQCIHPLRHNLSLGDSKHAQDDDGSAALQLWDFLVRAYDKNYSAVVCTRRISPPTHHKPATAC
jgi:hypothetical protein